MRNFVTASKSPSLLSRTVVLRRDLASRYRLSATKVSDLLNTRSPRHDPTFPIPMRLGASARGVLGWWEHEVEAWFESRRCSTDNKTCS